ncbi:cation transport ATPase [Candidatus Brocadia sinica JPN1]|uniref:Cation transport ATPase n=1 Tax=Candidatus Brocadia sinica JPN1 TaxID=1197129 RepID=A0ABQ0JXR9_9BACT|nr:cation transport ATPase [Candidatus Brocadia sinica JPN1]GIK13327.1 MAG: hypothetical protein BroJett002_20340 [Candidatus Brocadia sinica]GJQ19056.1 MAG: hypothetical protein HBSIN01_30150 [Candidatus Brocadia sinica]
MPKSILKKIGKGDDGAVRQFAGDDKVFLVKECREIPPFPDKVVIGYRNVVIVDKGILQRIQVSQWGQYRDECE